eukprot:NODE_1505_length_1124_cov_152.604303.p1 GENE.NODE_1505_length_1124_cov_152.604303~~NODE_1505_length_1124_cov_152.604303.p1  ORF type:complete len:265 (-),score=56.45 NODE_1505_length_1124_cov_152.604303:165-959(-)
MRAWSRDVGAPPTPAGPPSDTNCRVWVGGLPSDIAWHELHAEFSAQGPVKSISIRSSPRDTFAFVQFATRRDAEAAIAATDRARLWGCDGLRVKIAHLVLDGGTGGMSYGRAVLRGTGRVRRGGRGRRGCAGTAGDKDGTTQVGEPLAGEQPVASRSSSSTRARREGEAAWRAANLQLTLENVPRDMSWLELKNLGRMYGYIAHARTHDAPSGARCGLLEFSRVEDRERARRELDGQLIEGGKLPVRVLEGSFPRDAAPAPKPA